VLAPKREKGYLNAMGKRSASRPGRTARTPAERATAAGTSRYCARWSGQFTDDFFRPLHGGLTVSSVAAGTYLGESDDDTDARYAETLNAALAGGVNVIDTAINYRCQRSERTIGRVLRELLGTGAVQRDEIVVCTKAGYIPLDGTPPASREAYQEYVRREYFDAGLLQPEDVVAGGHAIAPAFLEDQLRRSLGNMGLDGVDYLYIHNPEQQLAGVPPEEFTRRMRLAFQAMEGCVSQGVIGAYGCATWSGLRLPAGSAGHLSLFALEAIAREVAGESHHFRVVQLPVNLGMSEAVRVSTQRDARGRLVNVVDAAQQLGIDLVVSAPLLQGKLASDLPDEVRSAFAGSTDAQRALGFARSLPGVVTVAVGTRRVEHFRENVAGFRRTAG
jgi:aryl-alcohol dehydrogenase-like predicted oxidoreductase